MKKVLAISILIIFLVSCKKNDSAITSTQSSVSFIANGITVAVNGSLALNYINKVAGGNGQKAGYELVSLNTGKYIISLFILTSSDLKITSYNTTWNDYPNAEHTTCNIPGHTNESYANISNNNFMVVNITDVQNGYATGTFSGQLTNVYDRISNVTITNGQFKYLKISN